MLYFILQGLSTVRTDGQDFQIHHPQDAEDAVSEAVLSAYENIHKLRKEEAFRSWIFQILANVCRRKLKSRERTETELKEDHASATYCDGLRTDVERAFLILDVFILF